MNGFSLSGNATLDIPNVGAIRGSFQTKDEQDAERQQRWLERQIRLKPNADKGFDVLERYSGRFEGRFDGLVSEILVDARGKYEEGRFEAASKTLWNGINRLNTVSAPCWLDVSKRNIERIQCDKRLDATCRECEADFMLALAAYDGQQFADVVKLCRGIGTKIFNAKQALGSEYGGTSRPRSIRAPGVTARQAAKAARNKANRANRGERDREIAKRGGSGKKGG